MYMQVKVFFYRSKFCQDIKLKEVNELWNDNCVDNKILNMVQ
jgi:hypothetical protein